MYKKISIFNHTNIFVLTLAIVVASTLLPLFLAEKASAAYTCVYNGIAYTSVATRIYDNRAPQNYSECKARILCDTDRRGAIWFSNQSNYYTDDVIVTGGASTATVYIRGSFFTCQSGSTLKPTMNADRIVDQSATIRLNQPTGVVAGSLNRGTATTDWDFSTQGGSLSATLNVSGLGWGTSGCQTGYTCSSTTVQLYRCPVGGSICYADPVPVTVNRPIVWTLAPTTSISKDGGASGVSNITAYPGQIIRWTHRVSNSGPNTTNLDSSYGYTNSADLGTASSANSAVAAGLVINGAVSFQSLLTIQDADLGKTLCRATRVSPWNYSAAVTSVGYNTSAPPVCVSVPYVYDLTPSATINPDKAVEAGAVLNVTPAVTNSGTTKSKDTIWQLSKIVLPVGAVAKPSGASISTSTPCQYYGNCTLFQTGVAVFSTSGAATFVSGSSFGSHDDTVADLEVNQKICYALSVRDRSSSSTDWAHSAPDCVVVAKKPKVQVWGGDVKVGRSFGSAPLNSLSKIVTSISIKSPVSYGSWAEYALIAPGLIRGAGSGTALNNGLTNANQCLYSKLSFSNVINNVVCSASSEIGKYNFIKTSIPNVSAKYLTTSLTPHLSSAVSAVSLSAAQGLYTTDDNVTLNISGGNIPVGSWVVINSPTANVTISGDIKYNTSPSIDDISKIPQVVIIAKNISIASNVTQIDAWLIAQGTLTNGVINTCTGATPALCGGKLTINGPVMSNKLVLRRTAGSGSGAFSGEPAEIINLRADAYLWAYAQAGGAGRMWTVYSTGVPPRL